MSERSNDLIGFWTSVVRAATLIPAKVPLAVDKSVLKKLSELSTNRGELSTARKVTRDLKAFTNAERQWLEATVLALIRRVGEIASGHSPLQLTLTELPQL
jgi:hypothetical protein